MQANYKRCGGELWQQSTAAPAQLLLETKIALSSLTLSSASFKIIKIAHWEYLHFRFEKIQPTPLLQIKKKNPWKENSYVKCIQHYKKRWSFKKNFFLTFDILKYCVKSKNREGKKKFQLAGALNDVNQPYLCVADLQKRMKIQMENFFVPQQTTSLQDGPKGLFCSL